MSIMAIKCLRDIHKYLFENRFFCSFCRDFDQNLNFERFSQLSRDGANNEEKIELILSEYEFEKYSSLRVSSTLTVDQMRDLLRAKDVKERQIMFRYFYRKEKKKEFQKIRDLDKSRLYWQQKHQIYQQRDGEREGERHLGIWSSDGASLEYGLWHNSLFSKLLRPSVVRLRAIRQRNQSQFAQKLVIDLDFDSNLRFSDSRALVEQIHRAITANTNKCCDPFDINFVNCDPKSAIMEFLPKRLNENSRAFSHTFDSKSYLDLYPKRQLVYITQSAHNVLRTYSHTDTYIVAALNHKRQSVVATKAKYEKIRSARLPIKEHVNWRQGCNPSLGIDHQVQILNQMKISGDWKNSIADNVPKHWMKSIEDIAIEDELRRKRYSREEIRKNQN